MDKLKLSYERHFLGVELLLGALAGVAGWAILRTLLTTLDEEWISAIYSIEGSVYSNLFNASSVLVGVVLSGVSMALAFAELPRFHIIRDSGHYMTVYKIYVSAFRWLIALIAMSILGNVVIDARDSVPTFIAILTFIVSGIVCFRLYRCLWVFKFMVAFGLAKPSIQAKRAA